MLRVKPIRFGGIPCPMEPKRPSQLGRQNALSADLVHRHGLACREADQAIAKPQGQASAGLR